MALSVTRQGARFPGAFGVGLALSVGVCLGACGHAAANAAPAAAPAPAAPAVPPNEGSTRLQNGTIAYVMTHK
jgi:hypothetical protein